MARVVLDASAVVALVRDEPGAEVVRAHVEGAVISAVNLQEVIKELLEEITLDQSRVVISDLGLDIKPHDENAAYAAATLAEHTRRHGSGLGDRTCMALALALGVPVLTADRAWGKLTVPGLDVRLIRH